MWEIKDGGHLPKVDMGKRITQIVDQIASKSQLPRQCIRRPATQWCYILLSLSDAGGRRKAKMSATEPETLISQLLFSHWTFELLDPKNMGVAVGISLLSCIQAEIYVITYKRSVIGHHLWFTTYPDVGQSSRVAWLRKHGCGRWNVIVVLCTSLDLRIWSLGAAILDSPLPITYFELSSV